MHTVTDPSELTREQIELIHAAANNRGSLRVSVRATTKGKAISGKQITFFDPHDPHVAESYIESLHQLEHLLLLQQRGQRANYELTNFGWQMSRKLKQRGELRATSTSV
jgi:predicted transcriptional regulator